MKVTFANSFFDSLKSLRRKSRWYYKAWDLVRYDIPNFFLNIWIFRKGLWNHIWFDHTGVMMFMKAGIEDISKKIETRGLEIEHSRMKKVEAMKRASYLLERFIKDDFIELAEKELGLEVSPFRLDETEDGYSMVPPTDDDRKIFNRSTEMEKEMWEELWEILKGKEYDKNLTEEEYDKQFDGSGLNRWWD